jgi:hypothetical protein
MSNKKNDDGNKNPKKPGYLTRLFNKHIDETANNLEEIRDKVVLPSVQLGQNRLVSTYFGAKTGFLVGAFTTAGPGALPSAIIGGFIGLVGGPEAMKRLESAIKTKEEKTDRDPKLITQNKEYKNVPKQDR